MAKFVELNEAAQMLGMTPDQLVEMRSSGEIHGYRDGASWKFKIEEVERVAAEQAGGGPAEEDDFPFGDDDEASDESVLVSEEELGHSGETTSSTIIGRAGEADSSESDLSLSADADSGLALEEGSDLKLQTSGSSGASVDSDVALVPGSGSDSDVSLVPDPGSDKELETSSSGSLSGSGLDLESASASGTGNLGAGSSSDSGDLGLDSELALSDDDEVVLSGSGSASDLSLGAADSGINLSSPSDSGLSLEADSGINLQSPTDSGLSLDEEPLDMGGSSVSSLELPEDGEPLALDEFADESLQQDEQFMLTPSEDMPAQDESDSGSQVIALEDSEAFDQEAMAPAGQALLAESSGLEAQLDALGGGAAPAISPQAAYAAAEFPEAPYSAWNITGLVLILVFLSLTGILMMDVLRNMWGWEEGRDVSTGISQAISSAFGD